MTRGEPRDWEHPTLSDARRNAELPKGAPDPILDRPRFESIPARPLPGQVDVFGRIEPAPKPRKPRKRKRSQ